MKKRSLCRLMLAAAALSAAACRSPSPPVPAAELAALKMQPPPEMMSLPNPVRGHRFADTWGAPRSGGRKHEGVDISAERGTPVRSTADGIIICFSDGGLGGKAVYVQSAGAQHYYAHLSRTAGHRRYARVRAGDIIGYVGDTGNAKGMPQLHYGIYLPDGAVNPYPLIDQNR
ncbi:M23 family metallopeptidase [Neisseria leonii]|uniref:M23 family metallopeptidase n=1 Tax=Neisseria leonii TaxID=2995413 RepID=A0A9X4IF06_9NEIS|nr:M23 family metallopeptidase [Neisseria sp. 51.81]MDD9328678.1 M23 family metallopeptidase [Neisseria sp. 51.81]